MTRRPGSRRPDGRGWAAALAVASAMCVAHAALAQPSPATPGAGIPAAQAVRVATAVDRSETTVVEPVTLTVDVLADPEVRVGGLSPSPEVGQRLGGFTVAAVRREPADLAGDGTTLRHRWTIVLEPYLPGDAEIPGMRAIGVAGEGGTPPALGDPSTPLVVSVRSVVNQGAAFDAGAVRAPLDPEATRPSHGVGWGVAMAGAVVCAALGALGGLAMRPSPVRRVRRAFASLERGARRAAEIPDPAERARETVGLMRDALAALVGPRARSATGQEIGALLRSVDGVSREQAARVAALESWREHREFGGTGGKPPLWPDVPPMLRSIRDAAERGAVRGAGERGPEHPSAVGGAGRATGAVPVGRSGGGVA